MNSHGPKALVTGGAHRLGRVLVESLAAQGFDVAIHCNRSLTEAEALAADLREMGRDSFVVQADLRLSNAGKGLVGAVGAH